MLKLYAPVKIPFADIIVSETLKIMNEFNGSRLILKEIPLSNNINSINSYFNSRGISNLLTKLSFKRLGGELDYRNCHIDGSSLAGWKCSVVIPVSGCKNTFQYWYDGKYTNKFVAGNPSYGLITWNSTPNYLGKIEIFDSPMLCRVDVPHNAFGKDNEYRITCTLRFAGNETFEYLQEHLEN
jgi:hypothetical protein